MVIIKKINILKRVYFVIGIIIYLYLSYQIIIFLKSAQGIQRLRGVPRILMSIYKGPTVTISGSIIFKNYEKGFITIKALANEPKKPEDGIVYPPGQLIIAKVRIPRPGLYEIKVPKKIGKIYIVVMNIDPKNISIPTSRSHTINICRYKENPLNVNTRDIKGIDIEFTGQQISTTKNLDF